LGAATIVALAFILAELPICAELLIWVLTATIETTPAKTTNDFFMLFSLSVLEGPAQVCARAYARVNMRVKNGPENAVAIYLIAATRASTSLWLPPLRHRQTTDEGCVMKSNYA
jgi:hypothetical protein